MTAVVVRADARALPLPDGCADLIMTSPPYFGLRSYTDGGEHYGGQIGSEATPREWLASLLEATREWVRVLKPGGSVFVNLGDKYDSGTTTPRVNPGTVKDGQGQGWHQGTPRVSLGQPKSLMGLPWRYALACVDDLGLILRAEIVWAKPNGLPESVTDRVRRSHEQVFHFTRQPRYYAAVDEIREPSSVPDRRNNASAYTESLGRSWHDHLNDGERGNRVGTKTYNPLGKLPGSVWDIPSQPLTVPARLGVDHFAAFPMELPRRIILGWSPPGVCTACGEGIRPVVTGGRNGDGAKPHKAAQRVASFDWAAWKESTPHTITGYACACPQPDAPTRPALVVDPFGGTGTTALVATMHGRHGISFDRSADYCRLAVWRTTDPAQRAAAMQVPKPPPVPDGMDALFGISEVAP